MVDITNIQGVREGDDALVFGPELPVSNLASWAGTISYEIMAGISQRVKRVYINGE
jgi:alanine racemase